jgi:hypothetical protein
VDAGGLSWVVRDAPGISVSREGFTSGIGLTGDIDIPQECALTAAFRVSESVPVAYRKEWADGEKTPGVCLLTLFRKNPAIEYPAFYTRWYESHTPISLRIHPLWNYSRNTITEHLSEKKVIAGKTGSAPTEWFDGIVEEQVRTRSDLLNPIRFFGPWWKMVWNMAEVFFDSRAFIDYRSMETYLAAEYWLKTS